MAELVRHQSAKLVNVGSSPIGVSRKRVDRNGHVGMGLGLMGKDGKGYARIAQLVEHQSCKLATRVRFLVRALRRGVERKGMGRIGKDICPTNSMVEYQNGNLDIWVQFPGGARRNGLERRW